MGKLIIDGIEVGGSSSASSVKYDNKNSTLVSTNVQGAITELNESLNEQNKNLSNLGGFTPVIDETGKITGYKTSVGGADTVFPFSSLGEWSARKSSKAGSSITIGENKHTLFTITTGPSGDVYACIYDLKNMKIIYKNDTAGIIAKSYVDGVVKTKWSDNDTDTSTFYYLYL